MEIEITRFRVSKRVPLTISRGTTAEHENLWIRLRDEGIEGWGEAAAISFAEPPQTTERIEASLQEVIPALASMSAWDAQSFEACLEAHQTISAARAALDVARHDWLGKRVGQPLWRLWGLERERIVPSTVTIGIMSPQAACERVAQWEAQVSPKAWKLKLGSGAGIEADQAMVRAVLDIVPSEHWVMVDANGGWSLEDAKVMCAWLAARGIRYVEQPLPVGQEDDLAVLFRDVPLPIFADESCMDARDVIALSDRVHGINLKLLKAGGLREARRMIEVARTCGLKVMFGCFAETLITNSAAAQLSPMADFLDLDSSLNLRHDPFVGASWHEGRLVPNEQPGLGLSRRDGQEGGALDA